MEKMHIIEGIEQFIVNDADQWSSYSGPTFARRIETTTKNVRVQGTRRSQQVTFYNLEYWDIRRKMWINKWNISDVAIAGKLKEATSENTPGHLKLIGLEAGLITFWDL